MLLMGYKTDADATSAQSHITLRYKMAKILLLLLSSCFLLQLNSIQAHESFTRSETLSDDYTLEWTVDRENNEIVCTVKAHTLGYVGFGIHPDKGSMDGADMIVGGVGDDGKAYFTDGHGEGHHFVEDKSQDWKLLDAFESNGWTTLKFKRTLSPCDQEDDVPITNDTLRVIYGYGETDQVKHHHGNRGVQSLKLLDPNSRVGVDTSDFESFNVSITMEMPPDSTTYWESLHCFSNFKSKVHLVGYEGIIPTREAKKHVHHMVGFRCSIPHDPVQAAYFQALSNSTGGPEYGPKMKIVEFHCRDVMFIWTVGSYPVFFPDDVGVPFGRPDNQECIRLEVHYNNLENVKGLEIETGLTVYYTEELRKYDSITLSIGTYVLPHSIVPPGVKDFVHVGQCSPECTSAAFPPDGIKVFGSVLHTHIHGRKIRVRHFRGASELPWIAVDDHYDFNYQQYIALSDHVQILPGDQLITECSYDTISSDPPGATHQGESTLEEMCYAFLFVYPPSNLLHCLSAFSPQEEVLKPLGIGRLDISDPMNVTVMSPAEMKGLTLLNALNSKVNWTEEKINNLQEQMRWKNQMGLCRGSQTQKIIPKVSYPKNLTVYEPMFTCQKTSGEGPTSPLVASLLRMVILLVALIGRSIA